MIIDALRVRSGLWALKAAAPGEGPEGGLSLTAVNIKVGVVKVRVWALRGTQGMEMGSMLARLSNAMNDGDFSSFGGSGEKGWVMCTMGHKANKGRGTFRVNI
eukprot:748158-Hanusia_phi.AAC.1